VTNLPGFFISGYMENFCSAVESISSPHISQYRHGFKPFPSTLYVVTAISNPARFRSRYDLYRGFAKRVADAGAVLVTVEVAFGGRPFEVTEFGNPFHLQLRTDHELWHKENALNLGISRLPADWRYVAWIDADVQFARADWAQETLQQLQHFDFLQLFSHAQDLGPNHEPLKSFRSFAYSYHNQDKVSPLASGSKYYSGLDWHPGYAWAARRTALDHVGGLVDKAILGSADRHMAAALIGKVDTSYHPGVHRTYKDILHRWQERAERHVRRNLGYVDGVLYHHWHGKKADRKYSDRWKILVDRQFNHEVDLKRDSQGLYQLTDRSFRLRDDVRRYFRSRNEDSVDV